MPSPGFAKVPHDLLTDFRLTDGAKVLYGVLLRFSRQKGHCKPANRDLAVLLGVTLREIQRRLRELEISGWIHRVPVIGERNWIELVIPDQMVAPPMTRMSSPPDQMVAPPRPNGRPPIITSSKKELRSELRTPPSGGCGGAEPTNSTIDPDLEAAQAQAARLFPHTDFPAQVRKHWPDYPAPWWPCALEQAAVGKARFFAYVLSILHRFRDQGGPDATPASAAFTPGRNGSSGRRSSSQIDNAIELLRSKHKESANGTGTDSAAAH